MKTINLICSNCRRSFDIDVNELHYRHYLEGLPAIEAFPELDKENVQFFNIGLCGDCQKIFFNN